jgi:hypothetical protein
MAQNDHANEVKYELRVQPETAGRAWHATLEREGEARLEFESPLELARHLANLREPGTSLGQLR